MTYPCLSCGRNGRLPLVGRQVGRYPAFSCPCPCPMMDVGPTTFGQAAKTWAETRSSLVASRSWTLPPGPVDCNAMYSAVRCVRRASTLQVVTRERPRGRSACRSSCLPNTNNQHRPGQNGTVAGVQQVTGMCHRNVPWGSMTAATARQGLVLFSARTWMAWARVGA